MTSVNKDSRKSDTLDSTLKATKNLCVCNMTLPWIDGMELFFFSTYVHLNRLIGYKWRHHEHDRFISKCHHLVFRLNANWWCLFCDEPIKILLMSILTNQQVRWDGILETISLNRRKLNYHDISRSLRSQTNRRKVTQGIKTENGLIATHTAANSKKYYKKRNRVTSIEKGAVVGGISPARCRSMSCV